MGQQSSRYASHGTLKGAKLPPLPGVALPNMGEPARIKRYEVKVPHGKKGGDKLTIPIEGESVTITIPKTIKRIIDGKPVPQPMKAGDKFTYEHDTGPHKQVLVSTMPQLPGVVTIETKPMIYSNVSYAYYKQNNNDQKEQTSMAEVVGELLQESQEQLMRQTAELGCNACLSVNTNISIDSSGANGNSKIVLVTQTGSPCVVLKSSEIPMVEAEATIVVDYM